VFICDACQESLSRGKVKQHFSRCRNCWVLSCVDCQTRFEGDAYEKHISCISESEKYAGRKDKKKDDWGECVLAAIQEINDVTAKKAFEAIVARIGETTVPKKKQKFVNLCKSSAAFLHPSTVNTIWDSIESARKKMQEAQEAIKSAHKLQKEKATSELPEPKEEKSKLKKIDDKTIVATDNGDESEDIEKQKKQLKKQLKKGDLSKGIPIRELVESFGSKKTLKRIARSFPNTFEIEKNENGRRIKLVQQS